MINQDLLTQEEKNRINQLQPIQNVAQNGLATNSPQQTTSALVNPAVGQMTTPNQMGRPPVQTNEQANLNNPLWQSIVSQAEKDKANLMANTNFQAPPANFGIQASLQDVREFPNAGFTPQQVNTVWNQSDRLDRLGYLAGNAYDTAKTGLQNLFNIKPQQTGLQSASTSIQNNVQNALQPVSQPAPPVEMPGFSKYDPTKQFISTANQIAGMNTQPTPLQLPNQQFNRGNLDTNYQNALTGQGTQISIEDYNKLLGGFQSQNQGNITKTEAQKQEIFDRYKQLKEDQVKLADEAGKSTNPAQAARLLGRAAKAGAESTQLSKDYTGLVSQDTRLAQDQQKQLIQDALETERLKAFKQPEYAQELAKANLATQNKSDLAMQEYDARMKELGLEYGAKGNLANQGFKQDILKSALAVKTPENVSKSLEASNAMRNIELSRLAVSGTPEQRQKAQQELLISKSVFGKAPTPTEYKVTELNVGGEKVPFGYDPTKPTQPQIANFQANLQLQDLMKQSMEAKNDKAKQAEINAKIALLQANMK